MGEDEAEAQSTYNSVEEDGRGGGVPLGELLEEVKICPSDKESLLLVANPLQALNSGIAKILRSLMKADKTPESGLRDLLSKGLVPFSQAEEAAMAMFQGPKEAELLAK